MKPDMRGKHMLGRKLSEETKLKISLNHARHTLGKHLSGETKEKLRQHNLGKKQSKETIEKRVAHFRGRPVPMERRRRISASLKGDKCWNWRGGINPINKAIRDTIEYRNWRQAVFERDKFTCVWCGQVRGDIQADHIKPFSKFPELRFDINNGRTLCHSCHRTTETYGFRIKKYAKA